MNCSSYNAHALLLHATAAGTGIKAHTHTHTPTTSHHYRGKSEECWRRTATDTHNHKLRATRIAICYNSHGCDHTLKRSLNCSSGRLYAREHTHTHTHTSTLSRTKHCNYGTLPSHCLLRAVIVDKPTLRQTWP